MLLAISAALVIVNIYVIPAFDKVFAKYGAALPWQTRALIATSDFFVTWWPALLMLAVLGTFSVRGWVGTPAGRLWWDRMRLRLPIVGGLFQRIGLARFCQTFAMVLRAGVPLLQGLAVVGHAIGNQYMAERIRDMRTGIERGESITRTASASGLFTPIVAADARGGGGDRPRGRTAGRVRPLLFRGGRVPAEGPCRGHRAPS